MNKLVAVAVLFVFTACGTTDPTDEDAGPSTNTVGPLAGPLRGYVRASNQFHSTGQEALVTASFVEEGPGHGTFEITLTEQEDAQCTGTYNVISSSRMMITKDQGCALSLGVAVSYSVFGNWMVIQDDTIEMHLTRNSDTGDGDGDPAPSPNDQRDVLGTWEGEKDGFAWIFTIQATSFQALLHQSRSVGSFQGETVLSPQGSDDLAHLLIEDGFNTSSYIGRILTIRRQNDKLLINLAEPREGLTPRSIKTLCVCERD